jgi:hypothetical protein
VFVDGYLDALCTLRPADVRDFPCVGYGRGGVAYTLLKAGDLRADRALVKAAQRWAVAGLRARGARSRRSPRGSFARGRAGLHAVHALAAHMAGDDAAHRRELRRFVASTRRARGSLDLFQGMAGRLAGAAVVMRRIPDPEVRALGDELAARIVTALDNDARNPDHGEICALSDNHDLGPRGPRTASIAARVAGLLPHGLAHGRPGLVLAVLAWHAVSRSLPEDSLRRIVAAAHPYDVSALGPRRQADWAHGHAGMAMLFARAYVLLGDRAFLAWARNAASRVQGTPNVGVSLLDGAPGLAYSMLAVAGADPGGTWRDAAWTIAAQVLARIDVPDFAPYGVWTGLGGVCCLALDLLHGTAAGFPGIEA